MTVFRSPTEATALSETGAPRGGFTFAHIGNAALIESLYEKYRADPASVDASWQIFFAGFDLAHEAEGGGFVFKAHCEECIRVRLGSELTDYIQLFRRLGHLAADINPLAPKPPLPSELVAAAAAFARIDPGETFQVPDLPLVSPASFAEVHSLLAETYTGRFGAEVFDCATTEEVRWLEHRMESCRNRPPLSSERRREILQQLIHAQGFEQFLHQRYVGMKRFSLEGLDSLIPLLLTLATQAAGHGVKEICLAMAHRGRLNVLANILQKPPETMFFEFEDTQLHESIDGDVHFHQGYAATLATAAGPIDLYLAPNPSHLEAIDAVIEGFARARGERDSGTDSVAVLPLMIHGDAAVIGQGIVAETLNLAGLSHYATQGTIHIITNNQIGFTTAAEETRSFRYASDVAKVIRAPVFHVNADDPEAAVWSAILAVSYRQKFHRDVVIDLIGYRRHGHNETDEPAFTQPLMVQKIDQHPPLLQIYLEKLVAEGVMGADAAQSEIAAWRGRLNTAYDLIKAGGNPPPFVPPPSYAEVFRTEAVAAEHFFDEVTTSVPTARLQTLAQVITTLPEGFTPHPKMTKLLAARRAMMEGDGALDWGMGELLAYASLAAEGHPVRLAGQDSARGTFAHRHAVLHDQVNGAALELLQPKQTDWAQVTILNSPLSEGAVLGFEFGYAVARPEALVIWEAQFGDFGNGAQIVIDQFLAASEAKWRQTCALVLFLPHGFEGQGPEHSSARPERFLTLCGQGNMQVADVTTPAQLFHLLRRQLLRRFRKPLVLFTPKSLLRHPAVISPLAAFSADRFHEILPESEPHDPAEIKRIILCTGKIYYELLKARSTHADRRRIAIVRVEQLYPFPKRQLVDLIGGYRNAEQLIWVQEEPKNHGFWWFVRSRLDNAALASPIRFVGRMSAGSTAEGSRTNHNREQARILRDALDGCDLRG